MRWTPTSSSAARRPGPDAPVTPPAIEFDTPRLAFRVWQDRHRAPFAALNADPEVMRHFPALLSAEQTNAGIDIWRQQFEQQGWSNWAVELRATGEFIGFIGLSVPRRQLPFSPCVEIGWRLKRAAWGQGYAIEGAAACLRIGFEQLGLDEIVSFTALTNRPSEAVMQRIGMRRAAADFDHPALPQGHALQRHCLYTISRAQWDSLQARPALRQAAAAGTGPSHRERFFAYLRAYEAKDLPAIAAMLADDVQLCDWNLSVRGKAAALAETRKNFESAGRLEIHTGTIYESADGAVAAELQILIDGHVDLRVVDAIAFTDEGLIRQIRAYKGRPADD